MIKDHAFKHLPVSFLEEMKAEIDAELQFRHLCNTVYAEEMFNGELTEDEIRGVA